MCTRNVRAELTCRLPSESVNKVNWADDDGDSSGMCANIARISDDECAPWGRRVSSVMNPFD